MTEPERYDAVVLGSGEGGKYLAWHLAQSGQRVAVVERRWIGGSCPNINCLPSKNEIWSANAADLVRHAAQYGIDDRTGRRGHGAGAEAEASDGRWPDRGASGPLQGQRRRADHGPRALRGAEDDRGAPQRRRRARARRDGLPERRDTRHPSGRSRASQRPAAHAHRGARPRALALAPARPGRGYVGLELGQAYRRFGSRVTIVDRGRRLAGREDPDVSDESSRSSPMMASTRCFRPTRCA